MDLGAATDFLTQNELLGARHRSQKPSNKVSFAGVIPLDQPFFQSRDRAYGSMAVDGREVGVDTADRAALCKCFQGSKGRKEGL